MASTHITRAAQAGIGLEVSAAIHHAVQAIADYRAYRATLRELRRLDDQVLHDLGICPLNIRAEAAKAVYGY